MARALLFSLLALSLGCSGRQPTQGEATDPAVAPAAPPAAPRPCQSDADCQVHLNSCTCSCEAQHADTEGPTDAEWRTMCQGGPPRNCGAQSPCAGHSVRCDAATHYCALDDP